MFDEEYGDVTVHVDATPLMMELVNRIESLSERLGAVTFQLNETTRLLIGARDEAERAREAEGKFMAEQLAQRSAERENTDE